MLKDRSWQRRRLPKLAGVSCRWNKLRRARCGVPGGRQTAATHQVAPQVYSPPCHGFLFRAAAKLGKQVVMCTLRQHCVSSLQSVCKKKAEKYRAKESSPGLFITISFLVLTPMLLKL